MFHKLLLPLVLALSVVASAGCSKKKNPEDSKMAKLCVDASHQLRDNAGSADEETFKLMISNAFEACSGGCDDGNQDACKRLDEHTAKLCGVSPSVCESLCKTVTSPSLKKATCDFKPAPKK